MRGACQVADLTLMIRATRGRSMDGWMEGRGFRVRVRVSFRVS